MIKTISLIAVAGLACSYSSLDEQFVPTIEQASFTVASNNPEALASISILISVTAGKGANGLVVLDRVALRAEEGFDEILLLGVALPAAFEPQLNERETTSTMLVNVSTTNADLTPYCGSPVDLVVWVNDPSDDAAKNGDVVPVDIVCS